MKEFMEINVQLHMSGDMTYEEYQKHVNESAYTLGDYGRWVKFGDSYPPIVDTTPYHGTIVEVLYNGNPSFNSIYTCRDGSVHWRDYDFNQEFSWGEYEEYYWRFVPDPPGNFGYNVG